MKPELLNDILSNKRCYSCCCCICLVKSVGQREKCGSSTRIQSSDLKNSSAEPQRLNVELIEMWHKSCILQLIRDKPNNFFLYFISVSKFGILLVLFIQVKLHHRRWPDVGRAHYWVFLLFVGRNPHNQVHVWHAPSKLRVTSRENKIPSRVTIPLLSVAVSLFPGKLGKTIYGRAYHWSVISNIVGPKTSRYKIPQFSLKIL